MRALRVLDDPKNRPKLRLYTSLNSDGFTLIELLVTLSIVAILVMFALGTMNQSLSQTEKIVLIDELRVAVEYAKIRSLETGKSLYLESYEGLSPDWTIGARLVSKEEGVKQIIHEWRWRRAHWLITWSGVNGKSTIVFSPDPGQAISNGKFELNNPYTHQKIQLVLNRMGRLRED